MNLGPAGTREERPVGAKKVGLGPFKLIGCMYLTDALLKIVAFTKKATKSLAKGSIANESFLVK